MKSLPASGKRTIHPVTQTGSWEPDQGNSRWNPTQLDSNPRATEVHYQGNGIQVSLIQQHLANWLVYCMP
jgi:hypothetical protein